MNVLLLLTWRGALMVLVIASLDRLLATKIRARARRAWWLLVPLAFLLTFSLPVLPASNPGSGSAWPGWMVNSPLNTAIPVHPDASAETPLQWFARPKNLLVIMVTGSVLYLLIVVARTQSALRRWGRECLCTDAALLAVLEDCRVTAGITSTIGLVVSERVSAPLILGWLRPRILLPRALVASSSNEQLRGVLFHELAHHRFHDIPCTWLFTLVCGLHWFNPAAHFALHGWARFREEAADEAAIHWLGQTSGLTYGETLLHVLRHTNNQPSAPYIALAIVESVNQLSKRLTMIKHYERRSAHHLLTATILVVAATGILLRPVRAQNPSPSQKVTPSETVVAKPAPAPSISPADDRHALADLFRKKGYTLPETFVDDRLAAVVHEQFGDDRAAFLQSLQASGNTEASFRNTERETIMAQAMRYQLQQEAQEAKAKAIILPKLEVADLTLTATIELLAKEVRRLNPPVRGMDVLLDPQATQAFKDTKVRLNLSNVSLLEAMQAVAQQTGGKVVKTSRGMGIMAKPVEQGNGKPPAAPRPDSRSVGTP